MANVRMEGKRQAEPLGAPQGGKKNGCFYGGVVGDTDSKHSSSGWMFWEILSPFQMQKV